MGCRWLICAAFMGLAPAIASEPPAQIVVRALRDVDAVPYRRLFKGMAVFAEHHEIAPQARMRFRLYPRAKDASFAGLTLTLVAGSAETAIALDDTHAFDLPDDRSLADAGAMIVTNQPEGTYAWRVDIRTPCLPPAATWLLAAGGCASRGNGQIAVLTQERVDAALVRGVTSRDDVRRAWGDALVTKFPDGAEVWFYTYSESASQLVKYVPLVGRMAATGASVKELNILLDANGHVKKYVLQDIRLQ